MMTISFVPDSCKIVVPPDGADPGKVLVSAVVAEDTDTTASTYRKHEIVLHCHGFISRDNAQSLVDRVNGRGADMAQFWYPTGNISEQP